MDRKSGDAGVTAPLGTLALWVSGHLHVLPSASRLVLAGLQQMRLLPLSGISLLPVEPLSSQPLAEPSRVSAQSRTSLPLVNNCPFWSEVSSAIVAARERKYIEVCEE